MNIQTLKTLLWSIIVAAALVVTAASGAASLPGEFAEVNPAAAKLFSIMRISSNDISAQNLRMRDGEAGASDIDRHANAWIAANQDKFDAWIAKAMEAGE